MESNLKRHLVRLFVFGTLRQGQRFDFYMGGSTYQGKAYSRGQLMMAENGSVYIDVTDHNAYTVGEVYLVDFHSLKTIHHLETKSGEFPKGYDLTMIPIWYLDKNADHNFNLDNSQYAFYYRRRNEPIKIMGGDYSEFRDPVDVMGDFLRNTDRILTNPQDVVDYMKQQNIKIDF
ncbi:MAG: gamma-glutamylcyclotransferase [Bacteroidales bacterium]|nr:gamma-glutamylcyclotransferase [Bacteroidales bacterium]